MMKRYAAASSVDGQLTGEVVHINLFNVDAIRALRTVKGENTPSALATMVYMMGGTAFCVAESADAVANHVTQALKHI